MDRTMLKRWAVIIGIIIVNVLFHIGVAGCIAHGVQMLNSYFGWAASAREWMYGVCGMVYLLIQTPLVYAELKTKLESYLRWGMILF